MPNDRGTRIDPDWQPCERCVAFARERGFNDAAIREIADEFRDYWLACPGWRGRKVDWVATGSR